MQYTAGEYEAFYIYKCHLIANYDLELDDPAFLYEMMDAAHQELRYHERTERYEKCQFIVDFIEWFGETV